VSEDPVQGWLESVEGQLREAPVPEIWAMLAYVAGRDVELDEEELHASRRQAVLLLAAGGDPNRGLDLDGRAVTALAADLDATERRLELMRGIDELVGRSQTLPHVHESLFTLAAQPELAWRAYACALLAEELGDDEDGDEA
jgi:hypothetical protein